MMISYNHYASGAVGAFLYRRVLGVEPTEAGYRKFKFAPVVGGGITEVLPLDKDYDYLYDVGSYVVHLQVKDGTISFQDSQCPDHVCEQFGQLSEEGAWAACVPAGVYVKLAPLSEAEAAS